MEDEWVSQIAFSGTRHRVRPAARQPQKGSCCDLSVLARDKPATETRGVQCSAAASCGSPKPAVKPLAGLTFLPSVVDMDGERNAGRADEDFQDVGAV